MELQTVFYATGIVFMVIMLILIIALVISVWIIRTKIVRMQHMIESRLHLVSSILSMGGRAAATFVSTVKKNTRK